MYNKGDHHGNAKNSHEEANPRSKEFSKRPSFLGLKLTIVPSLVQSIEEKLNGAAEAVAPCIPPPKKDDIKMKPKHLPMHFLAIGSFSFEAKYQTDLTAKCYYGKQKLVWEILRGIVKEKIEIHWQDILSLEAVIEENQLGILKIELDKVPSLYRECAPKKGKQSSWVPSEDFTGGQASKYRRHFLRFFPGVLDQFYTTLLQNDERMLELSKKPYPSLSALCFDSHAEQRTTHFHYFSHDQCVQQLSHEAQLIVSTQQQQQAHQLSLFVTNGPTPPTSGSFSNETFNNQKLQHRQLAYWNQGLRFDDNLSSAKPDAFANHLQQIGPWMNQGPPSHINNMTQNGFKVPKIAYDQRYMKNITESIIAISGDLSLEASPACNSNTLNTIANIDCPITNGNSLNSMQQCPFVDELHRNAKMELIIGNPFHDSNLLQKIIACLEEEECNEERVDMIP